MQYQSFPELPSSSLLERERIQYVEECTAEVQRIRQDLPAFDASAFRPDIDRHASGLQSLKAEYIENGQSIRHTLQIYGEGFTELHSRRRILPVLIASAEKAVLEAEYQKLLAQQAHESQKLERFKVHVDESYQACVSAFDALGKLNNLIPSERVQIERQVATDYKKALIRFNCYSQALSIEQHSGINQIIGRSQAKIAAKSDEIQMMIDAILESK